MSPFLTIVLVLVVVPGSVRAILLDVHLPLKSSTNEWQQECPLSQALESNLALRQNFDGEQIDFFSKHVPHVTLYQTDFSLERTINGTASIDEAKMRLFLDTLHNISMVALPQCEVTISHSPNVNGPYAMWPVHLTECLQIVSDEIVDATYKFIKRPPTIPDWIWSLPEPQRSRKLNMIKRYGSPNVYEEFEPHITAGYDVSNDTGIGRSRRRTMNRIGTVMPRNCGGMVRRMAVGRVGVGGSVLQKGQIGEDIPLCPPDMTVA
mmetsp:Transcript_26599/g.57718  ORF Transcript_26599/g.57718 Transcript_26599/m.57718 type:complete len:264 (+) Transcript_26599:101-892(+)